MTETPLPTPSPSSPGAPAVLDADKVVTGLRDGNLPITSIVVATQQTDPAGELGQPDGYLSRAAFTDRRIASDHPAGSVRFGGVVEVFATHAGAAAGAGHVGDRVAGEHDLVSGDVVLRLAPALTAPEAAEYRSGLRMVTGNEATPAP